MNATQQAALILATLTKESPNQSLRANVVPDDAASNTHIFNANLDAPISYAVRQEIAHRVVACVKACDGITNVGRVGEGIVAIGERDVLLAALSTVQAELVTLLPRLSGAYASNIRALLDHIKPLLSK